MRQRPRSDGTILALDVRKRMEKEKQEEIPVGAEQANWDSWVMRPVYKNSGRIIKLAKAHPAKDFRIREKSTFDYTLMGS